MLKDAVEKGLRAFGVHFQQQKQYPKSSLKSVQDGYLQIIWHQQTISQLQEKVDHLEGQTVAIENKNKFHLDQLQKNKSNEIGMMESHYERQIKELNGFVNELMKDKDRLITDKMNIQKQVEAQMEQLKDKEKNGQAMMSKLNVKDSQINQLISEKAQVSTEKECKHKTIMDLNSKLKDKTQEILDLTHVNVDLKRQVESLKKEVENWNYKT